MQDIAVKDLQARELEMLLALSEILQKNGVRFWLAYGTVLGCVRHGGFIPWDDDIDLYIMGEDYPRVKEIFETQDTGFLALHDHESAKGYPYVFPKVVDTRTRLKEGEFAHLDYEGGVYLDLFPLFEVPNGKLRRKWRERRRYLRYAMVRGAFKDASKASGAKRLLLKLLATFVNPVRVQRKLYRGYLKPHTGKSVYVTEPNVFSEKSLVKACYFTGSEQRDFEGTPMPIPSQSAAYLTDVYGDYMRLPDEADRVPCHDFALLSFDK